MAKVSKKEKIKTSKNPQPLKIKLKSGDDNSQFAENIINTVREPLIVLDSELRIVTASRSFYDFFKVNPEETYGKLIYDIGNHQWDIPKLRELLETILPEKTTFDNYEVEQDFTSIGKHTLLLNARQIERAVGKEKIILLAIEDITERKHKEELLSEKNRLNNKYLEILLNHTHVPIIIWDSSFVITRFNLEFEKLSGYYQTELINKKIDMLFPKHNFDATWELINNSLNDEKLKVIEIDILTKDKEVKTVLWNSANIFDKKGKKIVATIAQDITEKKRAEVALRENEKFLKETQKIAQLGSYTLDVNTGIWKSSEILDAIFGIESDYDKSVEGWTSIIHPEWKQLMAEYFANEVVGQRKSFDKEYKIVRKSDKKERWVHGLGELVIDKENKSIKMIGTIRDITELKNAEQEIVNLNRVYALLSNTNEAIVRIKERQKLFNEICRIAIDNGKFRMAWIGIVNNDTNKVEVKASAGLIENYLEDINIDLSNEINSEGPTGKAIKNGTNIIANDIENDKNMLPWKENALRLGYKSSAAFPLNVFGKVIGAFSIYANQKDFFHQQEIRLLDEMAMDISFALEFLETEKNRKTVEENLRISEERFRSLYENSTIGLYRTTPDGTILMANKVLVKMLGFPSFEKLARRNLEKDGFEPSYERKEFLEKIEKDGEINNFESVWARQDGSKFFVRESAQAIRDSHGSTLYYDGVVEDITERKRAERINEALYRISQAIYSTENIDELYKNIHSDLSSIIPAKNFFIALLTDDEKKLYLAYNHDEKDAGELWTVDSDDPQSLTVEVLRSKRPILLNEKELYDRYSSGKNRVWGTAPKCWLGIPLMIRGKSIGVMAVQDYNRNAVYSQKDVLLLESAAGQIAIAIERKRAEETLRQEKDFSSTIVQSSPTFFVAIGSDGKTIMMNDSMLQTLGYTLSEVVGMDYLTNLVPVEDREMVAKIFNILVTISKPTVNENPILTKDGRKIIVEWHGKNILKPNGELDYFFGIGIDITERKRAEEEVRASQQIIEGIINLIPVRVFWKDKNLNYLGCNSIFALDAGFTDPKELIGKDDFQMGWRDQAELYRADDRKVIESGKSKLFIEEPQTTPEGKTITLLTSKIPLRDSKGEITGLLGTYIDITDRKNAEETLKQSEEKFRSYIDNAPDGIFVADETGRFIEVNEASCTVSGYSKNELLKMSIQDVLHEESLEAGMDYFKRLIQSGISKSELSIKHKNGLKRLCSVDAVRLSSTRFLGFTKDITERKRGEEVLRESEEKIRNIFETANEGICVTNKSEEIISANKKFTEMVGYSFDEIIGKNFKMSLLEEELTGYNERQKIRQTGKNDVYERRLVRKDSSIIWTTVAASPIVNKDGAFDGSFGMFTDITERKRMVEDLLKLSKAVEQSPASIIITDTKGNIEYINSKVTEITGYQFAEVQGKNPRIFSTGEMPKSKYKNLWDAVSSGKEWRGEFHNKKKNGELYWELASISPIINEKGVITHYIAVKEDITERKRTEEEITMLAHSLKSINECVSITDLEDKILFINESYLKTYGYDENELIGKNTNIVRSLNNPPELVKAILPSTLEGGWQGELWNKRKDGSEFMISLSTTIIHNKDRKPIGLIGVATDITERKRSEKELIKAKERAEESDKLKSEFLAQMSHEIRTPLNIIVGNAEYINESLGEKMDPEVRDCFGDIDLASKRIIRTVDLILNSAELQSSVYKPQFVTVDLNLDILKKLYQEHELFANQKGLEFIYFCEEKDTIVIGDEYSITQILANLINNAIKYTKKGKIEILLGKTNAGNIMVEVKDTGIGISKEFLPRIFEPFTQEDQGFARRFEGNGLGLVLVKKYCEMNNAVIEVESEKNVGSAFRIIFN